MSRLEGKVALVTGAGRGIGRGTAIALAEEGAAVAILEIASRNSCEAAAKEGIRGLSRVASREWGRAGIRVNIVWPFANSPGMLDWAGLDPEGHRAAMAQIPLRR